MIYLLEICGMVVGDLGIHVVLLEGSPKNKMNSYPKKKKILRDHKRLQRKMRCQTWQINGLGFKICGNHHYIAAIGDMEGACSLPHILGPLLFDWGHIF